MAPEEVWARVRLWIEGQGGGGEYAPRLYSVESESKTSWIVCVEYVDRSTGIALDGPAVFRYDEVRNGVEVA